MTGRPVVACACGNASLPADAKFCPQCGRATGVRHCPCGDVDVSPAARFCHRCGVPMDGRAPAPAPAALAGTPRPAGPPAPLPAANAPLPAGNGSVWLASGAALVLLLGLIVAKVWKDGSPATAAPATASAGSAGGAPFAGGASGPAPDISKMSPKERFLRLFNRVMEAGARGDTTTVINFLPMAIASYEQLPAPDAGDRFDAALLQLQANNIPAVKGLTDSIRAGVPKHLLATIMEATLARAEGRRDAETAALTRFKADYDAEVKAARPEYEERKALLDEFRKAADTP
ncbi:MAG: zinc ribbon domain-containing protein [Gemmatimonadales bacterium]|nr:zinc ribbon domain-containing protein [Gemmatimonadales bacterium]